MVPETGRTTRRQQWTARNRKAHALRFSSKRSRACRWYSYCASWPGRTTRTSITCASVSRPIRVISPPPPSRVAVPSLNRPFFRPNHVPRNQSGLPAHLSRYTRLLPVVLLQDHIHRAGRCAPKGMSSYHQCSVFFNWRLIVLAVSVQTIRRGVRRVQQKSHRPG